EKSIDISRYIIEKNQHNTFNPLELRKFCSYCYKHTIHRKINKKNKKLKIVYVSLFQGTIKII
ncbi:hypothetical protein VitviT2T_021216, partial [Vitis vinifera]